MERPALVCYVPGLDRRRLDEECAPRLVRLLGEYPPIEITTFPSTELVPSLVTGVPTHEHEIWQVSRREHVPETLATRLLSLVPDWATTLWQCGRQLLDTEFDLAAIPWRRRRHFHQHRFKYTRRQDDRLHFPTGPAPSTIFDAVGDKSRYQFQLRFEEIPRILRTLPTAGLQLEFLEFYAFDLFSHWNLDRPEAMRERTLQVDELVGQLHERCRAAGVTFTLLVDHGQELIRRRIDLLELFGSAGVAREEFHYFIEVGTARLWFETDRAREELTATLRAMPDLHVFTSNEMAQFDISFPDERFGELYVIAEHGVAFFPHDFYHPLANLYLGAKSRSQRPRITNPRHRANHGQHPDHPAERGYLVVADDTFERVTDEMRVIDFAPTILSIVGRRTPPTMPGNPAYRRRSRSAIPSQ